MKLGIVAFVFASLLAGRAASSAEIFYMDHDPMTHEYTGPVGPLVISGEIAPGDYERLLAKIADNRGRFTANNKVLLAGDDGDLGEAIKIATLVKALSLEVVVGPTTGECIGACFLIFAAADQHVTDGAHLLGLHRPQLLESQLDSLSPQDAAALGEGATAWARAVLTQDGVPQNLIEAMRQHAPDNVYWLTGADEESLGTLSPSLRRLLVTKCAWTETLEHDVFAGNKPMTALKAVWACRDRLTQPPARQALNLALAHGVTAHAATAGGANAHAKDAKGHAKIQAKPAAKDPNDPAKPKPQMTKPQTTKPPITKPQLTQRQITQPHGQTSPASDEAAATP